MLELAKSTCNNALRARACVCEYGGDVCVRCVCAHGDVCEGVCAHGGDVCVRVYVRMEEMCV